MSHLKKSCVKQDSRIGVDSGVESDLLLVFELNLFPVDGDAIKFGGEVLLIVLSEGLVPTIDGGSGSADAEPFAEVVTLR